MKTNSSLLYLGKLLLSSSAYILGAVAVSIIVMLLGLQPPPIPESVDSRRASLILMLESPLLVLPFYILHQPVLVCIGFFGVRWPISDILKYLTIAPLSFFLVLWLYEFLVRRSNLLRFLFGMKPGSQNLEWYARQVEIRGKV